MRERSRQAVTPKEEKALYCGAAREELSLSSTVSLILNKTILALVVMVTASLFLVGKACADSYTVRVRDVNGNPVSNVRMVGNYGFNLLSGRVTDSMGEFDFDTEDLTGASVLAFSKDAARVRFEPAELEVGPGQCPGRVCAVIAHEDPVGTTTLSWTVRAPNGTGIAGIPVTVSSSVARCETRATDPSGVVVFAVHRTPGVCADNNNTVADNFTTITARSPTGTSYVLSDPGSPKFSRCSREAISGFFVAVGGPAAALPVGSAITYKVTARNPQGTPRAGVTFTGPELGLLPEALRTTGVTGSFFVSTTQLGIPPQASWSLAAVSDYDVYPRQLTINPVTRTSNEVVFTAFSNFQKSGALVIDVRDGVDPRGGVAIGSPELAACGGSPVTNANGRAVLGYKVLAQCNDTDTDPRNDTASIMPALLGCQFTDNYQTPFERCTVENTTASFQAYCGEPAPQQYLVSGRVFDQNAEPLGGASIIRNGVLAATTSANGRYSVYVDEFTSPAFRAFSGNLIFDPQNVGISEIDRAHENINFAAIGPLNAPGATPTPPACPAAPTYTVRGTVTALDGSPLVGATISENNVPQTTTDAQGNYSFTVSALDDVWLTVEAGGRRFDPAARYFPDVRCDRLADFHEITEESYRLVGRVVDALYRPLVGARVSLVHGGNETVAETDEDGYYLLTVPDEANYVITASYPGHELSPALYSGEGERDETGLNFTSTTQPTPTPTPISPTPPPGSTPPPVPPTATPPGSSPPPGPPSTPTTPPGGGNPPPGPPSTPTTPPGGGNPPPSNPTPPPGATPPPGSTPPPGATPPPGTPPGTPVVPTATPINPPPTQPPSGPTAAPTWSPPTPPVGPPAPPTAAPTSPPPVTPTRTPVGVLTPPPSNTPVQPPPPAPTSTAIPTPTVVVPIQLASVCSNDPNVSLRWMITSAGPIEVALTWDIYGSSQSGSIVAPVGVTYLTTIREAGSNTLRLFRNGEMVAVQSATFAQCPATPTPTETPSPIPTETSTPIPPSYPTAGPTVTPPPSGPGPAPTPGNPPMTPPPVGPPTETPTPTVTPTPIVYSSFSGRLTGKDGASLSASVLAKLDRLGAEAIKIVAINRETAERFELSLERPYRYTLSVPAGVYRIRLVSSGLTILSRPASPVIDLIDGGPAEGAGTRAVRRTRVNFAVKVR